MAQFRIRNWKGQQVIDSVNKAVDRGLYKGSSHILNESNNIAPKDEGDLIRTSKVDIDEGNGKASVYYVQKYAARLHENPQFNFQGGREGKWLEKTMNAQGQRARDIIADEIRRGLGGI